MKQKPKPDPELRKWCDLLAQNLAPVDVVPPGWHTVAEIAAESGKALVTTSKRIRHYVKQGLAERKDFRIQLEQRVRPVPHYRLK
jgi:hypothetical protein